MIRKAESTDINMLTNLAVKLWPGHQAGELTMELADIMENSGAAFFIVEHEGNPLGFAQCQLRRDYVEGTESSPVGYLEPL